MMENFFAECHIVRLIFKAIKERLLCGLIQKTIKM